MEEEVGGEVEDEQVAQFEVSEEDVLELVEKEVPENFDEEPENFILPVHTGYVVEVEALNTSTTSTAVVLQTMAGGETFGTDIFQGREVWCFQQG